MQAHLLVGSIPAATTSIDGSAALSSFFTSSIITGCNSLIGSACNSWAFPSNRNHKFRQKRGQVIVASSSSATINGDQDHYAILGVTRDATSADIKRAYRLLARKYHPDVSKHSQAVEIFKRIRQAYEILSNGVTRAQYDQVLRFQEVTGRSYCGKSHYYPEFEDGLRTYRWAELRRKMKRERYWKHYYANEEHDAEEVAEEGNQDHRGPFTEVLRTTFISLFLLQTFGSQLALTFSGIMALFDRKLDAGYKIGHLIAWLLGGRGGVLLTLCLQFASWACGKTSSSVVALVVVAMWIGSKLASYAPIPQGALITLLYMSIKLQVDLN